MIEEGWGGTRDSVVLTGSQVMLRMLIVDHTLGSKALD